MKSKVAKAVMLLLSCLIFQTALAQRSERHSGLLLVSGKKTKIIPLGKKVKIWAGEENKVYRAKMLAVDDDFVYLSTGKRLPIKSIKSIRRKRIMFRDVGKASVATGVATGTALVEGAWEAADPYEYDTFTNSYREKSDPVSLKEGFLLMAGGVVVAVVVAVGVGIVTATVGGVVGIFEPRYYADKWKILPLNPMKDVVFISNR